MEEPKAPVPVGGTYFKSTIRKAREALQGRAFEHYEKLLKIIDMAASAGDFETAAKYAAWLIEHTPKEDGVAIIDESAAKPKQVAETGHKGPVIQIGLQVGGLNEKRDALPESIVIDVDSSA